MREPRRSSCERRTERGCHAGAIDLVVSKSDIRRIFEITMLDRIFTLYASREEALQVDGAASADSVE